MKTVKSPFANLNTHLAQLVADADRWLVRVEAGRRRTTGVVYRIEGDEALIATVAHVFGGDDALSVAHGDSPGVPARLAGWDPRTDLALLRTEAAGLAAAPFADDTDGLAVGHLALTLGRPGRRLQAMLGLVAGVGGPWQTGHGADVARFIEVDGRLPDGFSGGVLLDLDGRVLGLNTHALVRGGTTLPVETVRRVCELLATRGHMPRGHLGLGTQPVALPPVVVAREGQRVGLVVVSVEPEGPGGRAGVLLGDVLLRLDDRPLGSHGELVAARDALAGRSGALRVLRAGDVTTLDLSVGEKAGPASLDLGAPGAYRGCGRGRRCG